MFTGKFGNHDDDDDDVNDVQYAVIITSNVITFDVNQPPSAYWVLSHHTKVILQRLQVSPTFLALSPDYVEGLSPLTPLSAICSCSVSPIPRLSCILSARVKTSISQLDWLKVLMFQRMVLPEV